MSRCSWTLRVVPSFVFIFLVVGMCPAQSIPARGRRLNRSTLVGENAASVPLTRGKWAQFAEFLVPDSLSGANSVGMSGNTVVVDNGFGNSAVSVYFLGGTSSPAAFLNLPNGMSATYNIAVAIDGDTVVVGLTGTPSQAYVYVKPPGGWTNMTPTATLTATDGSEYFGGSVSISGNTIVVGDPDYVSTSAGAAYVYVKPAGGWTNMSQTAKLISSDGVANDDFGTSVSINGATIAIGADQYLSELASGKAYVFVEPASGWTNMTETAELTASGATNQEQIGWSIATDGNLVVVGAPAFFQSASGKSYLFQKPASGWINMTETATFTAADGQNGAEFGSSVGVSGRIVVVGAGRRGSTPNNLQGGVYVFEEPASGWQNIASNTVLTGSDAHYFDSVGVCLAMDGTALVAGSERYSLPAAAYVFGLYGQ